MTQPRTIVFHPQNHVGLGHTNRLAAVALAVHDLDASVRTPFVIEGAAHILLDSLQLPSVPLPSSHLLYETEYWSQWSKQERRALETTTSRAVLESLNPQLVVFDSFPNEAFASVVLEKGLPIVLCLRKAKRLDLQLQRMSYFLPHVRRVLIPHREGSFELPSEIKDISRFIGAIARQATAGPRVSREAGCPEIVISGGGGGHPDAVNFFNLAMRAVACIHDRGVSLKARLVAGPLFAGWAELEVVPGITIIPFDPTLPATMELADLIVCQGGYNTVAELEQITTRAIVVPGQRRWDDQFERAEQLAHEQARIRVFLGSTPAKLAEEMIELLRQPLPLVQKIEQQGARNGAQEILRLLSDVV